MRESFFPTDSEWNPDEDGTDTWCHQKMFALFHKKASPFYLKGALHFAGYAESQGHFTFISANHGKLLLYYPEDGYTAFYRRHKKDTHEPIENTGFHRCFRSIQKRIQASPKQNLRAVIPVFEHSSVGYGHVVTLVLDYDAQQKKLHPIVYDSIGRGTLMDRLASFWLSKEEATSDTILQQYLSTIFPQILPLQRVGYNHQNRRTNAHCGLFAFRVIHFALTSFMHEGIGTLAIPPSKSMEATDTHFLTPQHIQSIKDCIHKDELFFTDIVEQFERFDTPYKKMVAANTFFYKPEDFPPLRASLPSTAPAPL